MQSVNLNIRITPEILQQLNELCGETALSRSSLVRYLINEKHRDYFPHKTNTKDQMFEVIHFKT